mmetsp:Transcript_29613/g.76022  ORF Transcript_29613/g.76022 Transcript_29613/m.76022 type:complete len:527 (-) Transcript_29613:767-2347(-)
MERYPGQLLPRICDDSKRGRRAYFFCSAQEQRCWLALAQTTGVATIIFPTPAGSRGATMAELRRAKEAFVSGHAGTSLAEATAASLAVPAVVWVLCVLPPRWRPQALGLGRFLLDNALLAGPALAVLTERLTGAALLMGCGMGAALVLLARRLWPTPKQATHSVQEAMAAAAAARAMPCLCWYRAGMLLMTNLAILAVDFPVFPRRFAKAENYGTGLMDVGTGSFVFCQGVMRGAVLRSPSAGSATTWRSVWSSVVPLVLLGGARLLAVKGAEYQEHVSEYGVHWNFFITLAGVVLLAKLAPVSEHWGWRAAAGAGLVVLQQAGLQAGLGEVAMAEQRGPGLLSLNKEGVISLPGYLALHCLGWGGGGGLRWLLSRGARWGLPAAAVTTAAGLGAMWGAVLLAAAVAEPVSRRSCNAAYILWVAAHNGTAIAAFAAAEVAARWGQSLPGAAPAPLPLAEALSGNMLLAFLAANLLTGAVNLSINTLDTPDTAAIGILAAYALATNALAWALWRRGLALRPAASKQA